MAGYKSNVILTKRKGIQAFQNTLKHNHRNWDKDGVGFDPDLAQAHINRDLSGMNFYYLKQKDGSFKRVAKYDEMSRDAVDRLKETFEPIQVQHEKKMARETHKDRRITFKQLQDKSFTNFELLTNINVNYWVDKNVIKKEEFEDGEKQEYSLKKTLSILKPKEIDDWAELSIKWLENELDEYYTWRDADGNILLGKDGNPLHMGRENLISAAVHVDEGNIHIHYNVSSAMLDWDNKAVNYDNREVDEKGKWLKISDLSDEQLNERGFIHGPKGWMFVKENGDIQNFSASDWLPVNPNLPKKGALIHKFKTDHFTNKLNKRFQQMQTNYAQALQEDERFKEIVRGENKNETKKEYKTLEQYKRDTLDEITALQKKREEELKNPLAKVMAKELSAAEKYYAVYIDTGNDAQLNRAQEIWSKYDIEREIEHPARSKNTK